MVDNRPCIVRITAALLLLVIREKQRVVNLKIAQPSNQTELDNYFDLRWRILRQPLGMPKGSEKDQVEEISHHLCAYAEDGRLMGVAKFKPITKLLAQVSHVAVEERDRGQGVGSALVKNLEQELIAQGYKEAFLTAREINIPYFEKLGYELGEETVSPLPRIKLFKMHKALS